MGEDYEGNYGPGEIYNCRCYPEPLLRFDQTSWPAKVYYKGRVQHMTLAAFKRYLPAPAQELVA